MPLEKCLMKSRKIVCENYIFLSFRIKHHRCRNSEKHNVYTMFSKCDTFFFIIMRDTKWGS